MDTKHEVLEKQKKELRRYLEQFEQLHSKLMDTLNEAGERIHSIECVYELLLRRPENERLTQLRPLLMAIPVKQIDDLKAHIQHLVVALQTNRADVDQHRSKMDRLEDVRTGKLTRMRLLATLQTFTTLLERTQITCRQYESRLKRIISKQLKRTSFSLTDQLLNRLLHMELDETLLRPERFNAIVLDCPFINNLSSHCSSKLASSSKEKGASDESSNLFHFCRLVSSCFLALDGLRTALVILYSIFCDMCEELLMHKMIAEVEEINFNEIIDFTARIANKMKTDQLQDHDAFLLVSNANRKDKRRLALIVTILLFCVFLIIIIIVLLIVFLP